MALKDNNNHVNWFIDDEPIRNAVVDVIRFASIKKEPSFISDDESQESLVSSHEHNSVFDNEHDQQTLIGTETKFIASIETHTDNEASSLACTQVSRAGSSSSFRSKVPSGAVKNAWGSSSYSDLITMAILSSPSKKMTLQEIYEWIGNNIPYFGDKKDVRTTAGWKNSVRHTLSIRKKFIRLPNYELGNINYKSQWTINQGVNPPRKHKKIYQGNHIRAVGVPAWRRQNDVVPWQTGSPPVLQNVYCSHCGHASLISTSNQYYHHAEDTYHGVINL